MRRASITMKDVAKAAGVSVMTVSRAFKADKSVNDSTRKRILQLADELGYVFDATAATLRTQKTNFVAVTIPSINNANFADTVGALSDHLEAAGMQVLLGYSNYNTAREEALIEQLLRRRPEAIVVTGGHHSARGRSLLAGAGIPVIETWDLPADPIGHVVGFSNDATMVEMVDHLVASGRTKIAFIGGDSSEDTRGAARRRGYLAAMQAHGLKADRLISDGVVPVSMREGAAAMGRLLEAMPDTQAVVCVSDLSAFGALSECQRRGVDVPDDIAIAGFGAYEIAGVAHPQITTIDPQPRLIGSEAAKLILNVLSDADAHQNQTVEIDWVLRPAGTT